jgi:hypothetical protein
MCEIVCTQLLQHVHAAYTGTCMSVFRVGVKPSGGNNLGIQVDLYGLYFRDGPHPTNWLTCVEIQVQVKHVYFVSIQENIYKACTCQGCVPADGKLP